MVIVYYGTVQSQNNGWDRVQDSGIRSGDTEADGSESHGYCMAELMVWISTATCVYVDFEVRRSRHLLTRRY